MGFPSLTLLHALAFAGGVLLGLTLYLSYGLVLLGTVPLAYATWRRRLRPLLVAGAGLLAVVATFTAAGFWWFDGLAATRTEYLRSAARTRPYGYFVVANLAAFAIVLGPAVAVGLVRLRDTRVWVLVGAGLAAVALADLSGMSKAEVERIWLPFLPWVVLATAALPEAWLRRALAGQAALALAVAVGVDVLW